MKAFGSMMRARKRDAEAGAAAVAGGLVSFRTGLQELPEALARELHAEIRLTRAGHSAPARGPRAGPSAPRSSSRSCTTAVVYAAPAHCVDELDLDFPGGDRLKTLASISPSAGGRAGARLPAGGRGPSARRLRVPRARGRAPARARRHLLVHALPRAGARGPRDAHRVRRRRAESRTSPTPTCRRSPRACWTISAHCSAPRASRRSARFSSGPRRFRSTISPTAGSRRSWTRPSGGIPGSALAGSYREGVSIGEVIASGESGGASRGARRRA